MWVEGTARGEYIRRSLKTGSWERAAELVRVIDDSEEPGNTPERREEPVEQAVSEYLADAKARVKRSDALQTGHLLPQTAPRPPRRKAPDSLFTHTIVSMTGAADKILFPRVAQMEAALLH
jgi:hypothetical protein